MRKRSFSTRPISGSVAPTTDGTGPWGSPSSMRTGSGEGGVRTARRMKPQLPDAAATVREESERAYIGTDRPPGCESALKRTLQIVQLRTQCSVEHHGADLCAHSTEDRTVHPAVEHHLLLNNPGEGPLQLANGLGVERDRAHHRSTHPPRLLVRHVPEQPRDVGQHRQPV